MIHHSRHRDSLARLAAASLVVGAGLLLLWQAGILFQSDAAVSDCGGSGELQAADLSVTTDGESSAKVGLEAGELAPDFAFSSFGCERLQLSDFRGQAVLLNFWATWCIPCRAELPDLEAMERSQDGQVAVIAMNNSEQAGPAADFIDEVAVQLTAFGYDPAGAVAHRYAVQGMPTSYFIDGEGIVRRVVAGQLTPRLLESGVEAALTGSGP